MNLNAYDSIEPIYNTGTWVNSNYKKLYSRDIEYHPFCAFLKKYNKKLGVTDYYIALFDNQDKNKECHNVTRTNDNLIKINLAPIWNITTLKHIKGKALISVSLVEKNEDGVVYYIDI